MASFDDARRVSIGSAYRPESDGPAIGFCENVIDGEVCAEPVLNRNSWMCRKCREDMKEGWPDV